MIVNLCGKIILAVFTIVAIVLGFFCVYMVIKKIILDIREASSWYDYFKKYFIEKVGKESKSREYEI